MHVILFSASSCNDEITLTSDINPYCVWLHCRQVQAGAGRTGKWWGHQHFEASTPDLLIFAKGIASGYPFAGVAAREGYFETLPAGSLGGTYGGNAVACAAAVATMQVGML